VLRASIAGLARTLTRTGNGKVNLESFATPKPDTKLCWELSGSSGMMPSLCLNIDQVYATIKLPNTFSRNSPTSLKQIRYVPLRHIRAYQVVPAASLLSGKMTSTPQESCKRYLH
jgi:hypothetical protein